jgi:hypothetical protein
MLDSSTGTVHSIGVTGSGANSAELVFDLDIAGSITSFCVEFDSTPQVFAGFVTSLTTAFALKRPVTVSSTQTNPRATPKATYILLQ